MAVGGLVGGIFALSAGTAMAVSWHTVPTLTDADADADADNGDGHNVYMQVRVEGYGWSRYNGRQKSSVSFDQLNWDGAAQYTDDAYIRVCRDKGSLNPDNCSPTKHYQR